MTGSRQGTVALAQMLLLPLLLLVCASHAMADENEFICETTDASPELNDAIDASSQIGEIDAYCCQQSGGWWLKQYSCTDWHHVGGAATGMCSTDIFCMPCQDAKTFFYDLMEMCAEIISGSAKVGGQVRGLNDHHGYSKLILH